MKVLIYGQKVKDSDVKYIGALLTKLREYEVDILYYKEFAVAAQNKVTVDSNNTIASYDELSQHNVDTVITLGGDGTILNAVTLIRDLGIPILGINLGRLGFLASVEKAKISHAIHELMRKSYHIEERTLIEAEANYPIFEESPFALNDFTLSKRDTSSMVTVHTYINGEFLNSYWADGIIVATPTGSTGYSLSCGGPIIFPNSGNFVITPVAPHNLNVRPIVISDLSEIRFEIQGRSENFLATLDSRYTSVTDRHRITIRKAKFNIQLVDLRESSFQKTIHDKLMWGLDSRNR